MNIEISIRVRAAAATEFLPDLEANSAFDADLILSAGGTGGGDWSDILVTLTKALVAPLASILSVRAQGHDFTVTVGETKIQAKDIREMTVSDLESLLEKAGEIETRRLESSRPST